MKIDKSKIIQEMIDQPPVMDGFLAGDAAALLPTEEDLEGCLESLKHMIDQCIEDGRQVIHPFYVVHSRGPEGELVNVFIIEADFNENEEKNAITSAMAISLFDRDQCPTMVGLAAEAWSATYQRGEERRTQQVRHDPTRREIALTCVTTIDGRTKSSILPVDRGKGNTFVVAGEWADSDGGVQAILNALFGIYSQIMESDEFVDKLRYDLGSKLERCVRIYPLDEFMKGGKPK